MNLMIRRANRLKLLGETIDYRVSFRDESICFLSSEVIQRLVKSRREFYDGYERDLNINRQSRFFGLYSSWNTAKNMISNSSNNLFMAVNIHRGGGGK